MSMSIIQYTGYSTLFSQIAGKKSKLIVIDVGSMLKLDVNQTMTDRFIAKKCLGFLFKMFSFLAYASKSCKKTKLL
jgi:hypothetical protein